ncbi:reprolysin-like metallopeptidase [Paraglaciecola sp. L1A13]|uniref:reprolysin-like metallopeptidase n=1 Tax=Paraglaciecola sp. L1A13 TaxID=2686359 RepID=UPI00131A9CDC|nr:zinc-dependent metalloprotease family protein [Paraglaciecola sp. L1A13]
MQVVNRQIINKITQRIMFVVMSGFSALNINNAFAEITWVESAQSKSVTTLNPEKVIASKGAYQSIDSDSLAQHFGDKSSTITLAVPLPDGTFADFTLTPSTVMSQKLADRYPQFMSYNAVQVNAAQNIGRFSLTHKGLTGIFRQQNQWVLLSPLYENNASQYISYYYSDSEGESLLPLGVNDALLSPAVSSDDTNLQLTTAQKTTGDTLTTYRLALSATAEYTAEVGGTKADAVAEMITLVNRVNQILLVDTAIQFELVDNDDIIFTDPDTDPYSDSDANADIETNQQVIDDAVGSDNYDIGHLLATNPGGLAYVGVVCLSAYKAQGYTGNTNPQGERFYIDLVIHELGHQLDAEHSFNAQDLDSCDEEQRSSFSAFEPGSGSTIMSYAGICSTQNIQNNSSPYFHAGSVEQIRDYVETGRGRLCGTTTSLTNSAPSLTLTNDNYTIPANTPFLLDVEADDSDLLTYTWEQIDVGGVDGGTANASEMASDNGANPLFRSYAAVSDSYRYFPALADVLNDTVSFGEAYATTNRELNFRVTVKDNKGGVNTADVSLDVVDTGTEFTVNQPNASSVWQGNIAQTISWNTALTENAPISCQFVDITADLDGDSVFDSTLASNAANDGEHVIFSPNTNTTNARVKISCVDNVFYAVNPANFTINQGDTSVAPIIDGQSILTVDEDTSITITLDNLQVTDPDSSYPDNFTLSLEAGADYSLENNITVVPDSNFNGELSISVTVNDGIEDSNSFALVLSVNPINDAPEANDDSETVEQDSATTLINVLGNDIDIDGDTLSISDISYIGNGTASISGDQISYQPSAAFSGTESLTYIASDGSSTSSATLSITVSATSTTPVTSSNSGGGSLGFFWIWFLGAIAYIRQSQIRLN